MEERTRIQVDTDCEVIGINNSISRRDSIDS